MPALPLSGTRVGVFGKGGAGKSTVVVLLATALRERGYKVVVVDADSSNVGLHLALGLAREPHSLLKHFGGTVFSGGDVTCPVDDPRPLAGAEFALKRFPGKCYAENREGIGLVIAGKLGGMGPGAGCDGPVAKIARDLNIVSTSENLVTLLDLKAGFEDTARGVVTTLDQALVVVDPTVAAMELAAEMKRTVELIHAGVPPATAHLEDPDLRALARKSFRDAKIRRVLVVVNKVDGAVMEQDVRSKLARKNLTPAGVVYSDPLIAAAWLEGAKLMWTPLGHQLRRIVASLESGASMHVKGRHDYEMQHVARG
jgi:CO dehydrogenase nickel-insertion accessory protein CooC1